MKRERWASVLTVSVKFRLPGFSKSNKIGKYPYIRRASLRASKTALRSGVKRPRMRTALIHPSSNQRENIYILALYFNRVNFIIQNYPIITTLIYFAFRRNVNIDVNGKLMLYWRKLEREFVASSSLGRFCHGCRRCYAFVSNGFACFHY